MTSNSARRRDPELSPEFLKNPDDEAFLDGLNDSLRGQVDRLLARVRYSEETGSSIALQILDVF